MSMFFPIKPQELEDQAAVDAFLQTNKVTKCARSVFSEDAPPRSKKNFGGGRHAIALRKRRQLIVLDEIKQMTKKKIPPKEISELMGLSLKSVQMFQAQIKALEATK